MGADEVTAWSKALSANSTVRRHQDDIKILTDRSIAYYDLMNERPWVEDIPGGLVSWAAELSQARTRVITALGPFDYQEDFSNPLTRAVLQKIRDDVEEGTRQANKDALSTLNGEQCTENETEKADSMLGEQP